MLRGEKEIAFGPFLCLAAACTVLAWPAIWAYSDGYFARGWMLIVVLIGSLGLIVVLLPPVRWLVKKLGAGNY